MKPGRGESMEEVAQIHQAARSPSPREGMSQGRDESAARRQSNSGHTDTVDISEASGDRTRARDTWLSSEQNGSLDTELPIHDQIKQGILGFVENEIKKSDSTKPPSYVFYCHDPSELEDHLTVKSLSRPSSGHREKRSPSHKKKRRHTSRRERDLHSEFEIPGSSLSALEKVDDYLKEYNMDEVVTLSGDLEIEANDLANNNENGSTKEARYKQRKARKKARDERPDGNTNGSDYPRVHTSAKIKHGNKPARPTNLSSMLTMLEQSQPERYIDNPFSSPSPVTTPSDARARPARVYLQGGVGGGTFRAVDRDALAGGTAHADDNKYLRLGELSPVDVAVWTQRSWRRLAPACHGLLAGLAVAHLLLLACTDGLDASHLAFHALLAQPYATAYYLLCVLCLVSALDRLDAGGLRLHARPLALVAVYSGCLLLCTAARHHDESMELQYGALLHNATLNNLTATPAPELYGVWLQLSVWRASLALLGLVLLVLTDPPDLLLEHLSQLLQFKQSLEPIG